jgi:hypothetical protein
MQGVERARLLADPASTYSRTPCTGMIAMKSTAAQDPTDPEAWISIKKGEKGWVSA